jgi:drug/metabolite transporter (DMT)-like permease
MDQRHPVRGIIYILIAWLLFTLMTLFARYACDAASLGTVLFYQSVFGLVTVLPWLFKDRAFLRPNRYWLLIFRSLVSLSAIGLSFLAVQRTSLADTMLLNNASPLWIPFVIWIWLKKPIDHSMWPGIIGGLIGVLLILKPDHGILQVGALLALAAGVLQSLNMVSIRQLSHSEKTHTVMFYYFLICTLVTIPFVEWTQFSLMAWDAILAVGLTFALGQWAFVRAFHHGQASLLGPFCYSAVVYSVLLDWLLYKEVPDLLAWIGIALISAGGIWAIRFRSS